MQWKMLGAAAAVLMLAAAPTTAQTGSTRRFTQDPNMPERPDKIVYVPLGWILPERPPSMEYDVAAAAWYRVTAGTTGKAADHTLIPGQYVLEQLDFANDASGRPLLLRAVITRRDLPGKNTADVDFTAPVLRATRVDSAISSQGSPVRVEPLPDGARYTYLFQRPHAAFLAGSSSAALPDRPEFELAFVPARGAQLPRYITGAPTFGGESVVVQGQMAPPRVRPYERVAGERQILILPETPNQGKSPRENKQER